MIWGQYFDRDAFQVTETGIDNEIPYEQLERWQLFARYWIDPLEGYLRSRLGQKAANPNVLLITSAFRSEAVNAKVGGVKTSLHRGHYERKGVALAAAAADLCIAKDPVGLNKILVDTIRGILRFEEIVIYKNRVHLGVLPLDPLLMRGEIVHK